MNEFIFLSLENIDDILIFSQVCKKWNEIYKKWKNEWYTLHTQITSFIDEHGDKQKTKIIGNRKYVMAWWENDNKMYEREFKDGKKEGKWFGWWEGGNKMYEREYKDGKAEEKWTMWYDNGEKMDEREYKDGKAEEKWFGWYPGGNKMYEKKYKNGKLDGKWIEWYENGKKSYEGEFKDGKEKGWFGWC